MDDVKDVTISQINKLDTNEQRNSLEEHKYKNHLGRALAKAQSSIVTPKKNRKVDFIDKNGRRVFYKYADLADVLEAIRKPFSENELSVFSQMGMTNGMFGLTTFIVHSSGQMVSTWYPLPDPQKQSIKPQEFGSSLTYARRYSISSLVGIASEEDDDGNLGAKTLPPEKPKSQTQPQNQSRPPQNAPLPKNNTMALGEFILPVGGEGVQGKRIADIPHSKLIELNAWLKSQLDAKPRVANFKQLAQVAGEVRAFLKTIPVAPIKPEVESQSFPPDDVPTVPQERNAPSSALKKAVNDPAKFVIPESVLNTDGKTLDQMPEDMLKNIASWLAGAIKATPPPSNLPALFESNQKVRAFLKSVGIEL